MQLSFKAISKFVLNFKISICSINQLPCGMKIGLKAVAYCFLFPSMCCCRGVRPFGVSLLIAGWDEDRPYLFQSDPSVSVLFSIDPTALLTPLSASEIYFVFQNLILSLSAIYLLHLQKTQKVLAVTRSRKNSLQLKCLLFCLTLTGCLLCLESHGHGEELCEWENIPREEVLEY